MLLCSGDGGHITIYKASDKGLYDWLEILPEESKKRKFQDSVQADTANSGALRHAIYNARHAIH